MPTLKLHAKVLADAEAIDGKRTKYSVEGAPGLLLDCKPSGDRAWFVRYQVGHGRNGRKRQLMRIGTFDKDEKAPDHLSLANARKKAAGIVSGAADGADPYADAHRVETESLTLDAAFELWLSPEGKRRKRTLARRTLEGYNGIYTRHLKKRLGERALSGITSDDVRRAIDGIRKTTTNAKRGHRGTQSSKALVILRMVCRFAVDRNIIARDPTRGVDDLVPAMHPDGKQTRALTNDELRTMWREIDAHASTAAARVIKLVHLTGRRVSEITGARREELRLDQNPPLLMIPASREGNKSKKPDVLPLAPMALAIVREAIEADTGEHLFIGAINANTPGHAFTDYRNSKEWPGRVRLHDARTLINDHLAMMQVPQETRSRILNHTGDLKALVNSVYTAYDHLPERYRALRFWEVRLRNIVAGTALHRLKW